jgi:hypothetical protein
MLIAAQYITFYYAECVALTGRANNTKKNLLHSHVHILFLVFLSVCSFS